MIRLCWALLLLFPLSAMASTVVVRGGEHEGFTRLVFQSRAAAGFSIVAIPEGWEVQLGPAVSGFDVSAAWRLIGNERVLDLEARADGRLRIHATCQCHIRPWRFQGQPVVDLYHGETRQGYGDIARYIPAQTEPESELAPRKATVAEVDTVAAPPPDGIRNAVDRAARRVTAAQARAEDIIALAAARKRAAALEAQLREALADPSSQDEPEASYKVAAGTDLPVDDANDGPSHLPMPPLHGLTADGRICPDPLLLDPNHWTVSPVVAPDFASLYIGALADPDNWQSQDLGKAALYYLYFGFGAEAKQLLKALATPDPFLLEIANIFDPEAGDPALSSLAAWRSCPSVLGLWALLAQPLPSPADPLAEDAVVLSFQSFPQHLREFVGPQLIAALLSAGKAQAADRIRNLMALIEQRSTETILAEAQVDTALGAKDKAKETITAALLSGSPPAPELVLRQAQQKMSEKASLSREEASALEALAFEYRRQPLGPEIQKTLTQNDIISQNFLGARRRLGEKLRAQDTSTLYQDLYLATSELGSDTNFLRMVLPEPSGLAESPHAAAAREVIAARLTKLGFAQEALTILGDPLTPESRLIAAQALMDLGKFEQALSLVSAATDPEAVALQARAYESLGHAERAISLYMTAGLTEPAAALSLLRGDWSEAAERAGVLSGAAAALADATETRFDDPYTQAMRLLDVTAREGAAFAPLTQKAN